MAIPSIADFNRADINLQKTDEFTNSPNPTFVDINGVEKTTLEGVRQQTAASAGLGFATLAELQAVTPGPNDTIMGEVTNDGENTGRYRWNGTQWVKSDSPTEAKVVALENEMPNKVDKYDGNRPGVLVAITDNGGTATFLEANDTTGGPTPWSAKMIGESQGLRIASVPGYLAVLTDAAGNFTDIAIESETGQFAQFVVDRLKARIGPITPVVEILYEQNRGGTHEIGSGDFYNRNGEILPALTDMTKLAGWGSSSMERSATAYQALANSLGMEWFPGGIGGQATPQIAARAGSIPALVTFPGNSIPASGTNISVTISNVPGHASQDYTGHINGVYGRIYYPGGGARFDRLTDGEAVPVDPDTPFLPEGGQVNRAAVNLLWMGRNDLNGDVARVDQVVKNTDATFDWLAPLVKRSLVMGHFKGNLTPSDAVFDHIDQVNAAHRKRYGNLFIDVNAYLISSQIWTDMGITPTQADLDAQAVGTTPPSVLADSLHLTPAAYQAVATYCVRAQMVFLGWIQP